MNFDYDISCADRTIVRGNVIADFGSGAAMIVIFEAALTLTDTRSELIDPSR